MMRRRFIVASLFALVLSAGPYASARAESVKAIGQRIDRAHALFEQWRFPEAIAAAEGLYAEHPGLPPVQYLAGRAKFYKQDYQGAIALLERATLGEVKGGQGQAARLLERVKGTLKATRHYISFTSEHFELRVPPGPDEVMAPYALEALEKAWQNLGDDFDFHPTGRLVVETFDGADQLSAASGLPVEAIKNSGTIAICKYNKLMFTSPKALLRGYTWLDTLSHEYVHFVVSRVSHNSVPIWLHEGIAKYEETRWSGAAGRALSPWAEKLLSEAVKGERDFITFEEMSPSMAYLPTQEATSLAFAEVATAIEFLVAEKGGYAALRRVIEELKSGKTDADAVKDALGISFEQFQRDWKVWLARRPMRQQKGATAETLTFKEDVKGKVVEGADDEADAASGLDNERAKKFAHLGELLRARNHYAAAAVEYEKAWNLTGGDGDALLAVKLARTWLRLERFDDAERLLKGTLESEPNFVTTHVVLGQLYVGTEAWDKAEAVLLDAMAINPFDPAIHGLLMKTWHETGDKKKTQRAATALDLLGEMGQRKARSATRREDLKEGELSIASTPWARVFIDGENTKLTTPVFRQPLSAGEHTVKLVTETGDEKELKVTIEVGEETRLEIDL